MKTCILTLLLLTLCVYSLSASDLSAHGKIRQKRAWIIDSYSIEEENPGPFPYVLGTINVEKQYLVHFILKGKGVDEEPTGVLSIDRKTGTVSVHKKVDYESYSVLRLTFEALNDSNSMVDTRLGVEILINDINDNVPLFSQLYQETTLDESASQGLYAATVEASDDDKVNTNNSTFKFRIASVTPKTDNVEFYIEQIQSTGTIRFKGCLDYEKAQKYTLLIEAKDNGDKVQLSSTSTLVLNIKDQNNHFPIITGQTGPAKIKEQTTGVEILRLQVNDRDSPGTPAWKAKFTIHGDNADYFRIETDPKTNEGILTVIKEMDYEEKITRNISISVANEVPYFSCKVVGRPSYGTMWDVETFTETSQLIEPKLYPVTITVEDVNEPPVFVPPVQKVKVMENTKVGTVLAHLTAVDLDKTSASSFSFFKGTDVENWVTVDPKSGDISVVALMDRESPSVKNSSYSVLVYVVDDAKPPMTGTGTLIINLGDENDNIPTLVVNTAGICLSENVSMASLTAQDLDLPPFTAPFYYELQGDVKGSWAIDPSSGTTVNLVKGKNVYSGHYELQVKILDSQGMGKVQNLSVTVCDCTITPNCHVRRSVTTEPSWSAIGIIILAFLLAFLLMAFLVTCKIERAMMETLCDLDVGDSRPVKCNIEGPGTDCMVPDIPLNQKSNSMKSLNPRTPKYQMSHNDISRHESMVIKTVQDFSEANYSENIFSRSDYWRSSRHSYQQVPENGVWKFKGRKNVQGYEELYQRSEDFLHHRQAVESQLNKRLLGLQNPEHELGHYLPHCYSFEGEPGPEPGMNLDAISISETEFQLDDLSDLDFQFNKLAAVCRPDIKIPLVFNPNSFSL